MFTNKSLQIVIAFALALFCINYFWGDKKVFEDLALGEETKRYLATDAKGYPIHLVELNDEKKKLMQGWEARGRRPVLLVLGNSQTHSINQLKSGDRTYVSLLFDTLSPLGIDVLAHSIPNASLQEHLVMYKYWKTQLPVKMLVIPVFMDDMREDGLRDVFFKGMSDEHFVMVDTQSAIVRKLNAEYRKIGLTGQDNGSGDEDMNALKATVQESSELKLNDWLDANFKPWSNRATVRGDLFNDLYNLRNTVLGINASTKRKMIPARMELNYSALTELLQDAEKSNIQVLVYVPPIRHDVELPYEIDQYNEFKKNLRQTAIQYRATFADLDTIVPGKYWGLKNATNTSGKKELDYMHFQYQGHILLSQHLIPYIFQNIHK